MKEYVVQAIKKSGHAYFELRIAGSENCLPLVMGITTLAEAWAERAREHSEWRMDANVDRLFTIPAKFTTFDSERRVILHEEVSSEDLVKLTERYLSSCQR